MYIYIDIHVFFPLWLTFPVDTAVTFDSTNQLLHPVEISLEAWQTHKFITRRLAQIRHIDSFHSKQYFCRHPYEAENSGCSPTHPQLSSGNMLIISFDTHPAHAHIIQSGVGFCIQRETGPQTRRSSSAEPYCACLSNSSSLNIRWPCHFIFRSCFMMNEVSGARCFLESSSRTGETKASIRQSQKWLCQSSTLSSYYKWFLIVSIEPFHGCTNRNRRKSLQAWREICSFNQSFNSVCMRGTWGQQQAAVSIYWYSHI